MALAADVLSAFSEVLKGFRDQIVASVNALAVRQASLEERVKRLEARSVPARRPESFEEISEEFKRKGGNFSQAEKFWSHYQMVGWVTGKAKLPIKDWRQAVSQWIRRDGGSAEEKALPRKPKEGIDWYLRDRGDGVFAKYAMIDGKRTGEPFELAKWEEAQA